MISWRGIPRGFVVIVCPALTGIASVKVPVETISSARNGALSGLFASNELQSFQLQHGLHQLSRPKRKIPAAMSNSDRVGAFGDVQGRPEWDRYHVKG